jgi:uncharacterized coiled-coil DUF342 family protein
MAEVKSEKAKELMDKKLEMINKLRELKAEISKVNIDLHKAGASMEQVICW